MNILYITHEYGDRWVKYATLLRELRHNVDLEVLKNKRIPNQVTAKRYSSKYDIVWSFAADYIWYKVLSDDFIDAVRNSRSTFVGYCTMNTVVPFQDWVNNYNVFDICFLHSKLVTEMAKAAGLTNVHYMPYGFDKDKYYKINTKRKFNVTFMGSAQTNKPPEQDDRVKIINALKGFGIKVFGRSLKGRVDKSIKVSKFSTHKEMNKVYNQSKINLNIPLINSTLPEFVNQYHPKDRFYEIPGSGNFMISGYADEFNEQFNQGIHCAYYYDIDDLCSKIEYYLTHAKEREELALAGHQHALKYHQMVFRFRDMMNIIMERYYSSSPGDFRTKSGTNEFFRWSDVKTCNIYGYKLLAKWWSRMYEYPWACQQMIDGEVVVDAGCGDIHPLKYILADRSTKVYGLDVDASAIEISKRVYHPSIEYIICDLTGIPLKSESVDSIYCISVLEHLSRSEFDKTMMEFLRILRSGGRFILTLDLPHKRYRRCSYTTGCLKNVRQFLSIVPREFVPVGPIIEKPGLDVVCHREFNLCVFHIIYKKERARNCLLHGIEGPSV